MEWILGGSTPNLSFKKKKKRGGRAGDSLICGEYVRSYSGE